MSRTYTASQIENANELLEIEILTVACENGHLSSSAWNDGDYDLMEVAEKMNIVTHDCPVCGGKAGNWGSGTCCGSCWGELYGEP